MTVRRHTRILPVPNGDTIPGGWLESLCLEKNGSDPDLVMDYRGLHPSAPARLVEKDGKVMEILQGYYRPYRLRFCRVTNLFMEGLYSELSKIPLDHSARSLRGLFYWRTFTGRVECILLNGSTEPASLEFSARDCVAEQVPPISPQVLEIERDWSPSIQLPARLVPQPRWLHQRFGGDPIGVFLDGKYRARRLFIGGVDIQPEVRPNVGSVLNLGEVPSAWADGQLLACDRWVQKGEGPKGMSAREIIAEAKWVIVRLYSGQRVLVHCYAGMNRSATICCAVLILLEGLSAEQALERVRERHPWARPDSHHWLTLRWIAQQRGL